MILFVLLLAAFIYFARYHFNTPLGWAICISTFLVIVKAPWFIFLLLWWLCWNATDEEWRYDCLINPLREFIHHFLGES